MCLPNPLICTLRMSFPNRCKSRLIPNSGLLQGFSMAGVDICIVIWLHGVMDI